MPGIIERVLHRDEIEINWERINGQRYARNKPAAFLDAAEGEPNSNIKAEKKECVTDERGKKDDVDGRLVEGDGEAIRATPNSGKKRILDEFALDGKSLEEKGSFG